MKTTALLIFASLILASCGKGSLCTGENKEKGIILNAHNILCLPETGQEFIINDTAAYRAVFADMPPCDLPAIDFNSETLLGLYTTGTCNVRYTREVERIEAEKRYIYNVIIHSCGWCKSLVVNYNWVTVPKLPEGWTVTFESEER
ncbi:MAG: hypothetical protein M3Q97_01285 [Bacteroidota bacterium]|nr:hypothetical protein [Bacteroidota bacterium]